MSRQGDGRTNSDDGPVHQGEDWRLVEQQHYEPRGVRELTTAIVYAVADAEGVEPVEVKNPPLYEVVDVSAIEEGFFGPAATDQRADGTGRVEFQYRDFLVVVGSDGWIEVHEPVS